MKSTKIFSFVSLAHKNSGYRQSFWIFEKIVSVDRQKAYKLSINSAKCCVQVHQTDNSIKGWFRYWWDGSKWTC